MSTVLAPPLTTLFMPGHPGWDEARRAWNLAVDQRPAAVAFPASAPDVSDVIRFARNCGLRVAAQGTGHNAAPLGSLADTILVEQARGATAPSSVGMSGVLKLDGALKLRGAADARDGAAADPDLAVVIATDVYPAPAA